MDELFADMVSRGLASYGDWLLQAIAQHNPRVSLLLAQTVVVEYDVWDWMVYLQCSSWN